MRDAAQSLLLTELEIEPIQHGLEGLSEVGVGVAASDDLAHPLQVGEIIECQLVLAWGTSASPSSSGSRGGPVCAPSWLTSNSRLPSRKLVNTL